MAVLQESFVHSAVILCGPMSGTKDIDINETLRGSHGPKSDTSVLYFTSCGGGPLRDDAITWVPSDEEAGMTS